MKIAILTTQYPSEINHYAHTFVHRRSLYFLEQGHDVKVFIPSKKEEEYVFEGVSVSRDKASQICERLNNYDVIYFHLLNIYPQPWLNGEIIYNHVIKNKIPSAFYMHGSEVQSISRSRDFDQDKSFYQLARTVYKDIYFMPKMRKITKKLYHLGCLFMTPSVWMHKEAQKQLGFEFSAKIIPNGINTEVFRCDTQLDNTKMLCIRPFNSNKYAVDIAIKTMAHLPDKFTLDIYGKGKKIEEYRQLISDLQLSERVKIKTKFIDNKDMPEVMARYSYFLSPTRMDAQGVSMCEAMSCARVVISSNNTAIPEFIEHNVDGILGDIPQDMAKKIIAIESDKNLKMQIAANARSKMKKIDNNKTLSLELSYLEELVYENNA